MLVRVDVTARPHQPPSACELWNADAGFVDGFWLPGVGAGLCVEAPDRAACDGFVGFLDTDEDGQSFADCCIAPEGFGFIVTI